MRFFLPLLVAIVLAPALAQARIGAADVREGPRGGPCFGISPREERQGRPDFHAVVVTDGQRTVWRMTMPPERSFPLGFSTCVPYGGKVAALPRTRADALEAGKVYYLRIEARPGKESGAAQVYEARFCLARQRDGTAVVHQIWDGERPGKRLFGCLPPSE